MASNGGDVVTPQAEVPNSEQAGKSSPKPDKLVSKAVAEDLSVDRKVAEVKKNSSSAAKESDIPVAKNSPEAAVSIATTAPVNSHDISKTDKDSVELTKKDSASDDSKPSSTACTNESSTNGTNVSQPLAAASPITMVTTNTTAKESESSSTPPNQSKSVSEKEASSSNSPVSRSENETPGSKSIEPPVQTSTAQTPSKLSEAVSSTTAPVKPVPASSATTTNVAKPAQPAVTKLSPPPVKAVPPVATVAPMPKATPAKTANNGGSSGSKHGSDSRPDGEAPPEKKSKLSNPALPATSKAPSHSGTGSSSSTVVASGGGAGKTPQQILEYMDKTFEHRRRIITKQMPTIPELQSLYPDLFMHKQLLTEFQRITKIDIDQKIQEFCVRFATAVIEMARGKKGSAPVIARWETAQQENRTLKQYWDMMTALCLLPLHFGEDFADMVQEIGEDEEVVPQGKIVPVLVARGNIFRTDEFFLIAENTIVQEFEEFTIALASLYSSYWVFNMVYPDSIENTYNYIQRCIVRQKEPGSIPTVCRNFTKALQRWNKEKEGK